jgi:hypothetical protein
MVQANFPYFKQRFQIVGFQLNENDRYVTLVPKLGDVSVFSGVNIFDKAVVTYRPATKEDPVAILLNDPATKK